MDIAGIRAVMDQRWRDYVRQRFGVSVRTSWDDDGITNEFSEDFEERDVEFSPERGHPSDAARAVCGRYLVRARVSRSR